MWAVSQTVNDYCDSQFTLFEHEEWIKTVNVKCEKDPWTWTWTVKVNCEHQLRLWTFNCASLCPPVLSELRAMILECECELDLWTWVASLNYNFEMVAWTVNVKYELWSSPFASPMWTVKVNNGLDHWSMISESELWTWTVNLNSELEQCTRTMNLECELKVKLWLLTVFLPVRQSDVNCCAIFHATAATSLDVPPPGTSGTLLQLVWVRPRLRYTFVNAFWVFFLIFVGKKLLISGPCELCHFLSLALGPINIETRIVWSLFFQLPKKTW